MWAACAPSFTVREPSLAKLVGLSPRVLAKLRDTWPVKFAEALGFTVVELLEPKSTSTDEGLTNSIAELPPLSISLLAKSEKTAGSVVLFAPLVSRPAVADLIACAVVPLEREKE